MIRISLCLSENKLGPAIRELFMDNKSISSWIRQARYRANKKDIYSDLEISDVKLTIEKFKNKCAYCDKSKKCWGNDADALDHAFNLSNEAPNVPANVIPVCKKIKSENKGCDVASLMAAGLIKKTTYLKILKILLDNKGAQTIKSYIKQIMGFIE